MGPRAASPRLLLILPFAGVWDEITDDEAILIVHDLLLEYGNSPEIDLAGEFIKTVLRRAVARIATTMPEQVISHPTQQSVDCVDRRYCSIEREMSLRTDGALARRRALFSPIRYNQHWKSCYECLLARRNPGTAP